MKKLKQVLTVAVLLVYTLQNVECLGKQYALNIPVVLLPYVPSATGVKANFTLSSPQGCFSWMSTKPDIVSVDPLYLEKEPGCSREAVLTAQSPQPIRLSSIIIAKELATGQTLRCDAFVASIERIEITTRTRELLLGEEPERFDVQAYDEEGNIFCTLGGHIFDWTLLPDESATHQQAPPEEILNFIPFEESSYSTDPAIRILEEKGLQGEKVLIAGVNTGTAKIQVRLRDKAWQKVKPDIVKLLVIENIMLQPSMDVYILPLSYVDYEVERRKHGRSDIITMPSEQYSLELTNTTVGKLDRERSRVTGLVVGYTEAVLQDMNMLHTPSASKPTAGIHVVPPHHIGYSIAPGNNWVLEVGREYAITVNVFDKLNHKIIITDNVLLSTELPSTHLLAYSSSTNGSYHHVKAIKRGMTTLHSTLSKLKHPETGEIRDLPTPVSKQQTVVINDPIKLIPSRLVILWDPQTQFKYQHQLNVTGGSGSYQWSCNPESVVGVASNGLITAKTKGKSLVTANDTKNTAHSDQTQVFVVPPVKMSFLPSRVEALLGAILTLPLQVKGYASLTPPMQPDDLLPFQDCSKLKLDITSTDQSVFNVTSHDSHLIHKPIGACTTLKAIALSPGHTRLTVTYRHRDILLQTTVTIAAYPPLRPVDPEAVAVVTLGSSKNFVFEGGPDPWILDHSKFTETLESDKSASVVSVRSVVRGGGPQHVYRVLCKGLGEEYLTLSVGNGATPTNRYPASEVTTSRISCAEPVSMAIRPLISDMPDCPLLTQSNKQNIQFPVRSGRPLTLEVVVLDSEEREFDNFTSLDWTWSSSNEIALPCPLTDSLEYRNKQAVLSVTLGDVSSETVVTATSNKYQTSVLAREGLSSQRPFSPGISFSLSLLLRNSPELTPAVLLLFNHPKNKDTLTISHGSGHFRVDHAPKLRSPASVLYSSETRQVTLTPFIEGSMSVTLTDLCLEMDKDASSAVNVAGVYSVEVDVADKLQLGNTTLAFVGVLDGRHVPFPASQLRFMNLQANPKSSHITVTPASNKILTKLSHDQISHSAVYVVTGVAVGTAHLLFNATSHGRVVSSWPKEVQVFDALQLSPKHITLLPSAIFQIRSSGGPVPHSTIVYSISNITVATVDDGGLIEAKTPGIAIVTGQAQAVDSNSGQLITYSQDEVHVHVIKLSGIKLFVPSTRLLAGEEIAIYAVGLADQSPFTFASANPGLSFDWSTSNMDVFSLSSVYEEASVSLQEERDFYAMLRTRNPGQGVVRISAKCGIGMCEPELATFTDQVQVQVVPPLRLIRPIDGHFLLPQNGEAKIVTNRDDISPLSYRLLQSVGGDSEGVIRVSHEGEISAAAVNGHAVVMVTDNEMDVGLNQSVVIHIEVQQIASLSIIPLSFAQATPSSKNHAYPLGYSAEFIVHLHDNIGRRFSFADIPLSHRLSRSDIVSVSPESGNSTYKIKASKKGDAILKVWTTPHAHISDYIRVQVGYAILPSLATVHLGCTICFTTHLTEDTKGVWSVGERGVVQIESNTGVGMARSTGRAVVYHSSHSTVDTHTEITVSKINRIGFPLPSTSLPSFTNGHRKSELGFYKIPVEFYHSGSETFSPLLISPACRNISNDSTGTYLQQVEFECQLELKTGNNSPLLAARFIVADSTFDPDTGESYCTLGPTEDMIVAETISTDNGLSLTLQVKVVDRLDTYQITSPNLKVPFVPAFVLNREEVRLGPGETSAVVKVTGLPQQLQSLKVVVSPPHPVTVARLSSPTSTEANYRITLITTQTPSTDHIYVTFTTTLAQQETRLLITLMSYDQSGKMPGKTDATTTPSTNPVPIENPISDDSMHIIVAIVTFVVIVIATLVICAAVKQGSSTPTSGFTAHLPPKQCPPQAAFTPSTPRTPFTQGTPPLSSGGSAFRRPGYSPSPQHGLFSQ